ncbi:hypothetical protein G6O69_17475 [Pseudenhygromyxa sp. WMMC2535]|uniref:hypothetical protein n=1 Tax=Pseudenhygromyxa sp. WMMC2535 TaxID=2712867 RepID=UPI0015954CFB|nr:hypothetical protein [Pseudenhygromyxa sp. WMMC2535]NVB39637.1 hypothetical protein [Pseudenhygromyxa sp. WMMC2535]
MSSRQKSFFATPSEVFSWIEESTSLLSLSAVLRHNPGQALEEWDGSKNSLLTSLFIYLAQSKTDLRTVPANNIMPGKLGWIRVVPPRLDQSRLSETVIQSRSDWWDNAIRSTCENRATHHLYAKITKVISPILKSPVHAKNIITGRTSSYQDMGYTDGAVELFNSGHGWVQEGTSNVIFSPRIFSE